MNINLLSNLQSLSAPEAQSYLDDHAGDELSAAHTLAFHRNALAGSGEPPDDTEVHHALFLMRRALGQESPSYDWVRSRLKSRAA